LITLKSYLTNNPLIERQADGLYCQTNLDVRGFEEEYIKVRKKEGRFYNVDEVKVLPNVPTDHKHYSEWLIRKKSMEQLVNHLKNRNFNNLLEVGCGNGWLTSQLAMKLNCNLCGVDINKTELTQAAQIFSNDRIIFLQAEIFSEALPAQFFDSVIFSSSLQYFPDLDQALQKAFQLIHSAGEIHVIDTPFYAPHQIGDARRRTHKYFSEMGFPQLGNSYFHHSRATLNAYNFTYGHNPSSIYKRVLRAFFNTAYSPFPWVILKNDASSFG
jgi:ubiquinone/menaquinone biosynthesis C-methylase UbiE